MPDNVDYILQRDIRRKLIPVIGREPWVTVYANGEGTSIHSALVPDEHVAAVLSRPGWDLQKGSGGHEVSSDEESGHVYSRLSGSHPVEPLIWSRYYFSVFPDELELSEEYRLFHNLHHDRERGEFRKIGEDGTSDVVGRIRADGCELRVRELRQYLAIRRMHLAVYFQVWRESTIPLDKLPPDELQEKFRDELTCYDYGALVETMSSNPEVKTFSKTYGKRLVRPLELKTCGIGPYEEEKRFETFIISTDENGKNVEHSCDPDLLADNFGKNKGAPNYLTHVCFRREVLTRYYANPTKYSVVDGRIECKSLWSMDIDNNLKDLVSVALGDLGRDLPPAERLHWKAHNVPPDGARISEVNYRRNFLGEWTNPRAPDLVVKQVLECLHEPFEARFGWRLFRPLHDADEHCLASLRRLIAEEQAEFDEQVKNLTKVLVDSLNEEAIGGALTSRVKDEKGIGKLERWLLQAGFQEAHRHVVFLRTLQGVRSTGTVHRKGSDYETLWKRLGYEGMRLSEVFDELLGRAIEMLNDLRAWAEAAGVPASSAAGPPPAPPAP